MLFLLDANVRTVKWNGIPLHEASSAIVKEENNGDFYLTVRYPITDSGIYQLIKEDMLIKAPVPVLSAQLFRIKKPIENDDSLDITAYHISDDVMQRSIKPVSVVGQSCAMALSQMVQNAKTGLGDFSFTSDIMDSRTFNTTETETLYSVLMDGKHSIVGTWEGELVRDNFALSIKRSRGADRGVVITTHKNLKSYQRTKNSQGVVTRIHARSTFKPDGAEDEVTLRVTVDSPLINSYPYINEKEYENNNAETVEDLRKWAEAKFTNEGIDKVSDAIEIEAYELDGQVVHLGDTVNIKSRKHNVDLYKKAIAYEFNALTEEYISITFDDKPGVGGSGVSSGLSNAADAILGASATAQDVAVQRAVKNANAAFDAEFDKRAEKIYDGIEQAKADAEEYADKLKTEISQEFDTFEQEYQANKKRQDQQIADIFAKAQDNTNLATDAKNIGNQAKIDAATALAKALQYKNEAISEASRLDTVERQATETKLATAKSQAIAEAIKLVETAKSLLSGQVSSISTDLNQTKEAIKLLATRATVDALTGRVSSAESTLQVQAGEIASRVKTSDFDQAKQRISTAESSIVQIGNRITTEISETVAKIPTEIGNVNLIDNTDYRKGVTDWVEDGVSRSLINNYLKLQLLGTSNQRVYKYKDFNRPLTTGESITVSYIAYSSRNGVGFSASTFDARPENQRVTLSLTPTRFVKTFNLRSSRRLSLYVYGNVGDEVFIKDIQVERGVIASDWGLAPEDFMDEITSVKTIITQTAEGQEQLSTKLTETQGKVTAAETNIRQLVNDVSSKVSQATFDNLKKTVDSQGTSISQNQSAIALKAEKTYVDGVKKTADSAKTTASDALVKAQDNDQSITQAKAELKVATDKITSLVTKTDFNAATNRLSTLEISVEQQAGQIAQRLTSTQVEQAITEKGYQTKAQIDSNIASRGYITNSALQPYATMTALENKVIETAGEYTRLISETKALIPVDTVNRNLLITNNATPSSVLFGGETYPNPSVGTNYPNNSTIKSGIWVDAGAKYTFSKVTKTGNDNFWRVSYLDSDYQFVGRFAKQENSFTITIPSGVKYIWVSYPDNANCKIEKGDKATPFVLAVSDTTTVTAFNKVSETVDEYKRLISSGGSLSKAIQSADKFEKSIASGGDIYQAIQTAKGLVTTVSGANGLSTQVSQLASSYAIKYLNSSGDMLSQANLAPSQFLLEAAKIRLKGKTLADEIQAIDGKFNTLFVSDGTFGKLDATIIGAQAITGGQIKFDQAFFNNLMANDAYLKQLFAKTAFITQVQSVTMSASQISGGILKALNNAMEIQMNSGQILYYTDQAALKRILNGYPTQFVKFATGTVSGKGNAGVTVIGSNRYGTESTNDGGFVGIRAWNGANIDMIDVVGDTVRLASSAFDSADGWDVITLPNKLEIDAHNVNHRVSSRMKVGDVWLWKNTSTYSSLKETINLIIDNLQLLHNNKTTEKGYSYTMPAKV